MPDITAYLVKKPVPTDKGKYLLFLDRPGGGMFGNPTVIFAIDSLNLKTGKNRPPVYQAKTRLGLIQFPSDCPYLLIPRNLASGVTIPELAKLQQTEEDEWEEARKDRIPTPEKAVAGTGSGPSGYL